MEISLRNPPSSSQGGGEEERFEGKLDVSVLCQEWIVSLLIADEATFFFLQTNGSDFPVSSHPSFSSKFSLLLFQFSVLGKVWMKDSELYSCCPHFPLPSPFSATRDQVGITWTKGKRTIIYHDNLIGEHLSVNSYAN